MNHTTTATGAPLLAGQAARDFTCPVARVTYMRQRKPGAPESMRVQYWHGGKSVATEWVGFAQAKARSWWRARGPDGESMPSKTWWAITAGTKGLLREPTETTVSAMGEFPEIVQTVFAEEAACTAGQSVVLADGSAAHH